MDDRFSLSIDPSSLNETFRQLRSRLHGFWEEGQYTRVRLQLKGQPGAVELPIAAVLAGELGALALFGPLRALITHLSLGTMLEVELVHAPSEQVLAARDHLERGERDAAEFALREALERRPKDPAALYSLGLLFTETERLPEGAALLEQAAATEKHPDGLRAAAELRRLRAEGWIA